MADIEFTRTARRLALELRPLLLWLPEEAN